MSHNRKMTVAGALWTDNFGDILLASLASKPFLSHGIAVSSPLLHDAAVREAGIRRQGWIDACRSDHLLFVGGGYFSEPPSNVHRWAVSRYLRIFVWGDVYRLLGKPYSIVGVGAGPCDSPLTRFFVRRLCNGAERVVVRDERSRDALKGIGVRREVTVVADHALTIRPVPKPDSAAGGKIGFHLSSKVPALADALLALAKREPYAGNAWCIEDHPGEYEKTVASNPALKSFFADRIIRYRSCDGFVDDLSTLDLVVTSKLHVGIVASALGKKVCSIPYHAKVRRFYDDIGRSELCYSGDVKDSYEIAGHIDRCFHSPAVVIPPEIRERAGRIDAVLDEIAQSLSRGRR